MSPDDVAARVAWEALLTSLEQDAARPVVADATGEPWSGGQADGALSSGESSAGALSTGALSSGVGLIGATSADAAWTEPTGLGRMPRELVGRASRLLAAQRDRVAALEAERRRTLEHLGALQAVDSTREPRRAVYLDASA